MNHAQRPTVADPYMSEFDDIINGFERTEGRPVSKQTAELFKVFLALCWKTYRQGKNDATEGAPPNPEKVLRPLKDAAKDAATGDKKIRNLIIETITQEYMTGYRKGQTAPAGQERR